MSDFIPEEVILQILHKLPVKKIVQCTCICKSWKSLIKNPTFIFNHLKNQTHSSSQHKDPLLLIRVCSIEKEHYSLRFDNQSLQLYKPLDSPSLKCELPNPYFRVIASCNGIICLADDLVLFTYTYIFWNPLIRKFKKLPQPPNFTYETHGDFDAFIGFGFDCVTNDFKLLRIVMLRSLEGLGKPQPQAEVFSLNSGVWKNITGIAPKYEIAGRGSQAFVNGFIHFIGFRRDNCVMLCFHVGNEVFRRIKLPDSLVHEMPSYMLVSGFKESSVAIFYKDIYGPIRWDIWVMKEYGVVESWTKILSFDESIGLPTPLGFRKNGDLMLENYDGEIMSLEPRSQKTKHLGIHGKKPGCYSLVHGYVESLVLFDRAKKSKQCN